jgi:DNA-binding XRE family transcriptional regulator
MSDDEYFQSKVITLSNESRTEIMQERNKRKITQSELAFQINIPKKDMRDIEIGKKILTDKEITNIEKFLNITLIFDCNFEITLDDIKYDWRLLQFVKNQTLEMCEIALSKSWQAIKYVKNQTPKLSEIAAKKNWRALEFIKRQTPEICKHAFENDWHSIQFIQFQTPEICAVAVKNNGLSIQYIIKQTDELCELAVSQNWKALRFIKNQTKEICITAIKKNYLAIELVNNPSESICLKAIEINTKAIKFIKMRPLKLIISSTPLTDDCCSICQSNDDEPWSKLLMCKHKFHTKCFQLCDSSIHKKCPLCRTIYQLEEEKKDIYY